MKLLNLDKWLPAFKLKMPTRDLRKFFEADLPQANSGLEVACEAEGVLKSHVLGQQAAGVDHFLQKSLPCIALFYCDSPDI